MFKFRKEHLDAFEAQAVAQFTARVLGHVKAVWAAETGELGDAAVLESVQSAIKRAGILGLSAEYDVVRFVDLTFILGKDFESNPLSAWTRPLIADRSMTPTAKMDRLYQRMEDEFALIEKRKGRA
ncbi:MAG TPA: hypothetical protein VMZ27_02185 [Candidatus Saccharimonadales bacterium]|nr:hypothetical protein [Candidatus Saccharimonadales bacterium]